MNREWQVRRDTKIQGALGKREVTEPNETSGSVAYLGATPPLKKKDLLTVFLTISKKYRCLYMTYIIDFQLCLLTLLSSGKSTENYNSYFKISKTSAFSCR